MQKSRTTKAAMLASATLCSSVALVATFAALARLFTVQQYATYRLAMLVFSFAMSAMALGLPQALNYFLPGKALNPRSTVVNALAILAVGGSAFAALLLLGGDQLLARWLDNPHLSEALGWVALLVVLSLPAMLVQPCLVSRNRARAAALFQVFTRMATMTAVIAAAWVWASPTSALAGASLAAMVTLPAGIALMFAACREGPARPTLGGVRKLTAIGVPMGLTRILSGISVATDKFVVAAMCSAGAFAVYVNGAFEIPLAAIICSSVTSVLVCDYSVGFRNGQYEEIRRLWHRSIQKVGILLLPLGVLTFVLAPELMTLLFGARYASSATILRVYLLMLPARTSNFGSLFVATGNGWRLVPIQLSYLLVNLVASIGLVWLMGPVGAAIGTVAAFYLIAMPQYLQNIGRFLRVPAAKVYPAWKLLRMVTISVVPACVFLIPSQQEGLLRWIDLVGRSAIYLSISIPLLKITTLGKAPLLPHRRLAHAA